jgi:5-methylcytosine-specific restriction endonuclease McrA
MPYPSRFTPEELRARKKAQALARYYNRHEANKAKQKARWHARIAAMSPDELEAFRAANNARNQDWRLDNPETYKASKQASDKKYHETNREHLLAQMSKKHQARLAAMTPEELAEHQAKKNASMRLFYRAHTEEISRRKTIRGVKAEQRRLVIAAAHGVCAYCPHYNPTCKQCPKGGHKLTVDHITAIVKGGDSSLHNLIACCRSCNAKKHAKPTPIMVQPLLL